jgi:hypothetical protein
MLYPEGMNKRAGRPPTFPHARQYSVRLSEPDAARLRELGGGSVSMGISVLLNGATGSDAGHAPVDVEPPAIEQAP